MTNKRGEVRIKLGGRDWTLRPTFSALQNIEDRTGLGLLDLAQRASVGKIKFSDIAIIVWGGILGSKPKDAPTLEAIGDMILDEDDGFTAFIPQVRDFMVEILRSGPKEPVGNAETGAETK